MPSLATRPEPDATITNAGTLFQITPHTQAAKDWLRDNVEAEGFMWLGSSLCVEPRYIVDLAQGMFDAGLKVS